MKTQTTIKLRIEENILGATLFPAPARGYAHDYIPRPDQLLLWQLVAGTQADPSPPWGLGKEITPKEGEKDDLKWYQDLSARVQRVAENRPPCLVRVVPTLRAENGVSLEFKATAHWTKRNPNKPPNPWASVEGIWTLREFSANRKRPKVLRVIEATDDCEGDELYENLPGGEVPEGWEVLPEGWEVAVCGPDRSAPWYLFTFKPKSRRRPRFTLPGSVAQALNP